MRNWRWKRGRCPRQLLLPIRTAIQRDTYSVGLSKGARYDINKVFQAVDKVIDIVGAHPCISGFDFLFKDVLQSVVVNDKIEGQVFDQRF